jgi:hypothetical protein
MFRVMLDSAAAVTAAFGENPPTGWKWRSGIQIAENPC